MIELPTPETDALFWRNGYPVEVDSSKAMQLCEKLEQERDWITEKFKLLEGCFKRAERERADTKEHLRAANKGAERNAKINQSFANKIISIERELDEAMDANKKLREVLEWIAERYDDSKSMHQVAMDAYEMSCTAKAALRKEDAK